jgi:hypothetical protein
MAITIFMAGSRLLPPPALDERAVDRVNRFMFGADRQTLTKRLNQGLCQVAG